MRRDPQQLGRPSWEAYAALTGQREHDPHAIMRVLAETATIIATHLRRGEAGADTVRYGPPLSKAEDDAVVIDARRMLELVAALFGDPDSPACDDFAFAGALKKRPDWKPIPDYGPREAAKRRNAAARRVYELLAANALAGDHKPKIEAALQAVEEETRLNRRQIWQGMTNIRALAGGYLATDGTARAFQQAKRLGHAALLNMEIEKQRLKENCASDTGD